MLGIELPILLSKGVWAVSVIRYIYMTHDVTLDPLFINDLQKKLEKLLPCPWDNVV